MNTSKNLVAEIQEKKMRLYLFNKKLKPVFPQETYICTILIMKFLQLNLDFLDHQ